MKKVLFTLAFVAMMLPLRAQITEFPYEEMFNGATASEWVLTTLDECSEGVTIGTGTSYNYLQFSYPDATCEADQWAISPAITLPASASDFVLQYYAALGSWQGVESHYEVRLSTGSTTTTDFTVTLFTEEGDNDLSFEKRSIDLSSYAGQTIRIAFHNITSYDGNSMAITGVYVGQLPAPQVAIDGPTSAAVNTTVTFTAYSDDANATFDWTIDGVAQNTHDATLSTSFDAVGTYTVSVTATNAAGTSDPATIELSVIGCDPITNFPWVEDFEGNTDCWSFNNISSDNGLHVGYGISMYGTYTHSGEYYLLGAYNDDMDANQWAITPALTLPANASNFNISYFISLTEYEGIQTHYEVRVSTTGTAISDFSTLLHEETGSSMTDDYEYTWRTHSLSDFAGQTIYIAFHNITGQGGDAMWIDDITVGDATTGIENAEVANVAIYPNPVSEMLTVNGENVKSVEVIDVNGRVVLTNDRAGKLNMSELSDGVYMVRVMSLNGITTQKIVKK